MCVSNDRSITSTCAISEEEKTKKKNKLKHRILNARNLDRRAEKDIQTDEEDDDKNKKG